MSYLNAGIGKLTEQIYIAQADVATARSAVRKAVRANSDGWGSQVQVQSAVSLMNHQQSFASGLVRAWEIVTGEIWGAATWQAGNIRT